MSRYSLIIILIFLSIHICGQEDDIPYNLNRAYINGIVGFKVIKVTTTYDSRDYKATSLHYYNSKNQNYLTVDYYNDTLQGKYVFEFDKQGRVKKESNFSLWIDSWDSKNSNVLRYLDTTKVIWIIDYSYYQNGLTKVVNNTWFDERGATSRTILSYKYDNGSKILEEGTIDFDIDSLTEKLYFDPNSTKLSSNQNPPNIRRSLKKYSDRNGITIIEHYRDNQLKSKILTTKIKNKSIDFLIDLKGDTIRKTIINYSNLGKKTKEQVIGDCDISNFCEYGDGYGNDLVTYNYNKMGLIDLITYENTRLKIKQLVKFEYLKN